MHWVLDFAVSDLDPLQVVGHLVKMETSFASVVLGGGSCNLGSREPRDSCELCSVLGASDSRKGGPKTLLTQTRNPTPDTAVPAPYLPKLRSLIYSQRLLDSGML